CAEVKLSFYSVTPVIWLTEASSQTARGPFWFPKSGKNRSISDIKELLTYVATPPGASTLESESHQRPQVKGGE
ncbi:MAG: hypothetical protein K2P94_02495, partial [Rhodospirillaceae bacterium]|nr:hypothetical protein [Rhodospirillaceae bacterium]